MRITEMKDFTARYLSTRASNSTPLKRGSADGDSEHHQEYKIKLPLKNPLNFQAKENKVKPVVSKDFQSFYLTLDEFMLKRFRFVQ
jgi:hypothetical protein